MSNDEVRWTRSNVGKTETENNRNIHNLKYCDNCLVNSSNNREYAIERWTTKRKKKRTAPSTSKTAINSCHRPLFSATRKLFILSNLKIITLFLILTYSMSLTCAKAAVLDSTDSLKMGHYTHTWAVHIPNGDESGRADQVAEDHGFVNLGKVCVFTLIYIWTLYSFPNDVHLLCFTNLNLIALSEDLSFLQNNKNKR